MKKALPSFKHDGLFILWICIGIITVLSLASFNSSDPSINSFSLQGKTHNWCGIIGAYFSDILYQLFGLGAWPFSFCFFGIAIMIYKRHQKYQVLLALIFPFACISVLTALCAIHLPNWRLFGGMVRPEGLIGLGLSKVLHYLLGSAGAAVFLWSTMVVLVVLSVRRSLQQLVSDLNWTRLWVQQVILKTNKKLFSKLKKSQTDSKEEKIVPNHGVGALKTQTSLEKASNNPTEEVIKTSIEKILNLKDFEKDRNEDVEQVKRKSYSSVRIPKKIENWNLPKLSLLEDPPLLRNKVDEKEITKKANLLKDKLAQFSVSGDVTAARPGPAVTLFEFKPEAHVRVSKITELADDLALALSSESLRIMAPIPGRDVVGIETSNLQREIVYLKDMIAEDSFWKEDLKLPVALGKQADGEVKIVDLRKMPHLMVAGTTGSGKSVFTVSTITGLLFKHSPKTLRLILVDPKQVDLTVFDNVPHLIMPIITETKQAVGALKWAVREMEKRYRSMSRFGARGLEVYNDTVTKLTAEQLKTHEEENLQLEAAPGKKNEMYYYQHLPYIVIVVEEFGDLMTVDKANCETAVVRLAQMARACGIHLVLAMQSPRKEVVTGLIKTNIPGRISFKVNSGMDSRIILDETGAERLLAQGDMLFKSPGGSSLIRNHGPYLKDADIANVTKFWAEQSQPDFDQTALKAIQVFEGGNSDTSAFSQGNGEDQEQNYDDRYDEILSWAAQQKEISASLIQRRFQLGYPRAARIIETFEREGVCGPAQGSKPRQVLIGPIAASIN
jgi:S-DNA-T family DNA segregation ATPase FtsK/SpoIIIE